MKQVVVLPRKAVENSSKEELEKRFGKFAIISIFSSKTNGGGIPLNVREKFGIGVPGMDICFDDLDEGNKFIDENDVVFEEKHAWEIIWFFRIWNSFQMDDVDTLICQCDAGISRSGAVGLWATRFLKLDEKEFREKHPQIQPNSRVLEILMDVSGLKDEQINFWKENT